MPSSPRKIDPASITERILVLRGQRVLLDADLAELYDAPAKALNQAVRRNRKRFPPDFLFQATANEWISLRSQIVTLKNGRGMHRKYPPLAFTEHGAIMAATVLNSPRAVELSVYVVRAFIRLREVLASNADLARKLEMLEKSVTSLDSGMKKQFEEVYRAIRALMAPAAPKLRPIGFTRSSPRIDELQLHGASAGPGAVGERASEVFGGAEVGTFSGCCNLMSQSATSSSGGAIRWKRANHARLSRIRC